MTLAGRRQATYEDLLAVPEHSVGEIVGGELVVSPRPPMPNAGVATALGATLLPPFQFGNGGGPGGWRIFFEPQLHLSDDIVVPDIAGWRVERMLSSPTETFVTLSRDWRALPLNRSLPSANQSSACEQKAHYRVYGSRSCKGASKSS